MAYSCETKRSSAYSDDLRWRMVWQREILGHGYQTIAQNLNVDASTVWRAVKLFRDSGSVDNQYAKKSRSAQKLTAVLEFYILHTILSNPGIYLREFQAELLAITGTEVWSSSICRFLKGRNLSCQKLRMVAAQQDDDLWAQFACDVASYEPEMLVFLDETGCDRRNSIRKYGYSSRGKSAMS